MSFSQDCMGSSFSTSRLASRGGARAAIRGRGFVAVHSDLAGTGAVRLPFILCADDEGRG
jgi:hypothetical protein